MTWLRMIARTRYKVRVQWECEFDVEFLSRIEDASSSTTHTYEHSRRLLLGSNRGHTTANNIVEVEYIYITQMGLVSIRTSINISNFPLDTP